MPDVDLAIRHPAFSRCVQQRLNCALLVVSLSLGFFRFQGLNGISEPRIASGSVLAVDLRQKSLNLDLAVSILIFALSP